MSETVQSGSQQRMVSRRELEARVARTQRRGLVGVGGVFGQRASRALANRCRRTSSSSALKFFGTPFARRPSACAALFFTAFDDAGWREPVPALGAFVLNGENLHQRIAAPEDERRGAIRAFHNFLLKQGSNGRCCHGFTYKRLSVPRHGNSPIIFQAPFPSGRRGCGAGEIARRTKSAAQTANAESSDKAPRP